MTNQIQENEKTAVPHTVRGAVSAFFTVTACACVFLLSLFASDKISHSVRSALSLCSGVIIPSVFPFMIISDILYSYLNFSSLSTVGDIFERVFKINRRGLYPFVLGVLCGFPLGVKCTAELYRENKLSRDEAERIIGFCNNTGPAFLVSGIGLGLRGSVSEGVLLYIAMTLSAIAVGCLFGIGGSYTVGTDTPLTKKSFSLTSSIKNAGIGTLNVCSYLTFFACIVGLLRNSIGESLVYLSLLPFLEVGSASSILSKTRLLRDIQSLTLTAFAIGFSGLSVHLQALSFISDTDIRVNKYFLMKLMQGVLSALFVLLGYWILYR